MYNVSRVCKTEPLNIMFQLRLPQLNNPGVQTYFKAYVEACWLAAVQDPPLAIESIFYKVNEYIMTLNIWTD